VHCLSLDALEPAADDIPDSVSHSVASTSSAETLRAKLLAEKQLARLREANYTLEDVFGSDFRVMYRKDQLYLYMDSIINPKTGFHTVSV